MIHEIDSKQINEEIVKNSNKLVVINLYADWCMPCEMFRPVLQELDKKYKDAEFYQVNVDEAKEFVTLNNITATPTLLFYRDGVEKERIVGVKSIDNLSPIIDYYMA